MIGYISCNFNSLSEFTCVTQVDLLNSRQPNSLRWEINTMMTVIDSRYFVQ